MLSLTLRSEKASCQLDGKKPMTQCDSSAESPSASADRSRSPTNLADCDVEQAGSRILDRIEDKFDRHQYGALKGRSTTHALVDIM